MNKWHYISWHTDFEYYREYSRKMVESVEKNGVKPIVVVERPTCGTWLQDAIWKTEFIREQLDASDEDVLFLDSDCLVHSYPEIIDEIDADVAAHHRAGKELLGSTLYFKNCDATRELLDRWHVETRKLVPHHFADQIALQKLVKEYRFVELPPSYCQIFDHMKHCGVPVIEQLQASRNAPNK